MLPILHVIVTDVPILCLDVSCSHVHLQISAVSEVEQSYALKLVDVCGRRDAVLDKQRMAGVTCLHSVSSPLIL